MLPLMTAAMLLGIRERPVGGRDHARRRHAHEADGGGRAPPAAVPGVAIPPVALGVGARRGLRGSDRRSPRVVFGPHDFTFWVFTGNGGYVDIGGVVGYTAALGLRQTGWFLFGSAALVVLLPFAWRARRVDRDLWLWLASGVVAVALGFRFFPHYYLQLLPPLALLATRGHRRPVGVARRPRRPGGRGVLAIVSTAYFLAARLHAARNAGTHDRAGGRGVRPAPHRAATNGSSSGARRPRCTGHRIAARRRASPPRASSPVRPAAVHRVASGRSTQSPGAADDFFADLQRTPPALIADMSTADQRHAHYYPPKRFPRFQHFLDRGAWRQVAVVDGVAILRPGPRTPRRRR